MKNFLLNIILLICLVCSSVKAADLQKMNSNMVTDKKIKMFQRKDKQLHFIIGATISKIVYLSSGSMITGFLVASSVGALKELSDKQGKGVAELDDFIATTMGASLSLVLR